MARNKKKMNNDRYMNSDDVVVLAADVEAVLVGASAKSQCTLLPNKTGVPQLHDL